MDNMQIRETIMLQKLLDSGVEKKRLYLYEERLNTELRKHYNYAEKALKIDKMRKGEICDADKYILYALLVLRVANADTIYRFLKMLKIRQPDLLIQTDYEILKKRLNLLSRYGFVYKIQYIQNTKINFSDAVAAEKELIRQEKIKEKMEEEGSYYDSAEYLSTRANPFNDNFKKWFGKDAYLVTTYALDSDSYQILNSVLHPVVKNIGWVGEKMAAETIGMGAASLITAGLHELSSFSKFMSTQIRPLRSQVFSVLSEMEFKLSDNAAKEVFTYTAAVFSSYSYCDRAKQMEEDIRHHTFDKIINIKNYIGIKGINKQNRDAFVIVCVNDSVDMIRFADACMKVQITPAELSRIYFTGEGIIMKYGIEKMLQLEPNGDKDYITVAAKLPVFGSSNKNDERIFAVKEDEKIS